MSAAGVVMKTSAEKLSAPTSAVTAAQTARRRGPRGSAPSITTEIRACEILEHQLRPRPERAHERAEQQTKQRDHVHLPREARATAASPSTLGGS
jgi:hypothetical protein